MALHPGEMDAAIIRNLSAKTGRDLEGWIALLKSEPPFAKPKRAVEWLKAQHGLGHISAQIVVKHAGGAARASQDDLEHALFANASVEQGALYDHLKARLPAAMPGTIITPCKTYVGFGNPVQYAVVKPLRNGELAVGLASIATDLPAPAAAKGLGGGDKIRWKTAVRTQADIELVVRHLGAGKARKDG
jgi:hypothetical protein